MLDGIVHRNVQKIDWQNGLNVQYKEVNVRSRNNNYRIGFGSCKVRLVR